MLKSWRFWLAGLVCSLAWMSAIITYLIEWEIGWFFGLVMIMMMGLVWISEQDLRSLHQFQLITLQRQLAEAQQQERDRQDELDFFYRRIRDVTDQFLDEQAFVCKECGAASIWHYTPYKFHPSIHGNECMVARFRALIEPPPLWLLKDFDASALEARWVDSVALASDPRFTDFFPSQRKPGHECDREADNA